MEKIYVFLPFICMLIINTESFGMMTTDDAGSRQITRKFKPKIEPAPDTTNYQSQDLYENIPVLLDPRNGRYYREISIGEDKKSSKLSSQQPRNHLNPSQRPTIDENQLMIELKRQLSIQQFLANNNNTPEHLREEYRKNVEKLLTSIADLTPQHH